MKPKHKPSPEALPGELFGGLFHLLQYGTDDATTPPRPDNPPPDMAKKKKKRDQTAYRERMKKLNPAHRMAHKLTGLLERSETYLDDVKGTPDREPWKESDEIVEAFEASLAAQDRVIQLLSGKPDDYVPRLPKKKLRPVEGSIVAVLPKFTTEEHYGAVFSDEEMQTLVVVEVSDERLFVRPQDDEGGRPIPIRRSEVKLVSGGKPE